MQSCYEGMFKYCNNLKEAPVLPATTLVRSCYANMFTGCNNIEKIEVNFTDWNESIGSTTYWMSEITNKSGVNFICPEGLDTTTKDNSHVLSKWTIIRK